MSKDIHTGLGGSYAINEAGEKVLLHRTGYVPDKSANDSVKGVDNSSHTDEPLKKTARPTPKFEVVETQIKSTEAGNE